MLERVAIFSPQGLFPTQRLNPYLLHCRQVVYHWATWEAHILPIYLCISLVIHEYLSLAYLSLYLSIHLCTWWNTWNQEQCHIWKSKTKSNLKTILHSRRLSYAVGKLWTLRVLLRQRCQNGAQNFILDEVFCRSFPRTQKGKTLKTEQS